jgi:hypothetical protein
MILNFDTQIDTQQWFGAISNTCPHSGPDTLPSFEVPRHDPSLSPWEKPALILEGGMRWNIEDFLQFWRSSLGACPLTMVV